MASPLGILRHTGKELLWQEVGAAPTTDRRACQHGLNHQLGRELRQLIADSPDGDPLELLCRAFDLTRAKTAPEGDCGAERSVLAAQLPFAGGWIGYLSYELGRLIEPKACHGRPSGKGRRDLRDRSAASGAWPLYEWAYCPDAIIFDHGRRKWYCLGQDSDLHDELAREAPRRVESKCGIVPETCLTGPEAAYGLTSIRPVQSRAAVERSIASTIEYIGAGDVFQTNITQQFRACFQGDTRALFCAAMERNPPWYAAYLELDDSRCVISMSPELFLQLDERTREVITRPIKGTAPADADVRTLIDSEKDRAELNMIVDLMRNDLGRVCALGTVRVTDGRSIETHPTVHHGVATIRGRLRASADLCQLLQATFPGGSVTGAPKIRAMQIIDELEPAARGPYCGAIGFVSPGLGARLSIAIRTLLVDGASASYSTGGGIVADSTPSGEYGESLDKAEVLFQLATDGRSASSDNAEVPGIAMSRAQAEV